MEKNPKIPTAHIAAGDKQKIAKIVLMGGDPLRMRMIADNFLEDAFEFNHIRNMFGYTGYYKGKKISVMGSGMGCPSMGIYSYELFNFYDVDYIIRIGSTGAYRKELNLYDVVQVTSSFSQSTYAQAQSHDTSDTKLPSAHLNSLLVKSAREVDIKLKEVKVHTSDVFYQQNPKEFIEIRDKYNCDCVDMESFALFHNAEISNKHAATLLTVSDNLVTGATTTAEERQEKFTNMVKIALNLVNLV